MRQAAHYDLHTTEGLAQVQHLRFVLPSGEVDTQYNGMTIRGGVLDDGIRIMSGSEVIDGRATVQLPRLMAGCHRYDILIADHGTDKPLLAGVIHVAPRVTPVDVDDNAPADYLDIVIPEDEDGTITVISDSPAWVADALEACLPDALHDAGVYLTPTTGESTLSTGPAETPALVPCYAMAWGDELLAGHLPDGSRLRKVSMVYYNDAGNKADHWLRIWRQDENGSVVVGVAPAVPQPSSGELITWDFTPGVPLRRGDAIIMEMCVGSNADNLETHGLAVHGVMTTAKAGRGIADAVSYPVQITQPDIAPVMSAVVEYSEGIMVGGVEIATAAQMQSLGSDVRTASADAVTASRTAETAKADAQAAKDTAEQIANGLTITTGTVTTGAPGSQAAAEFKPGSTPGSYTLDMTIPQGAQGTVDTAQAYAWTQPQTYAAMINANAGVNIPMVAGAPTDTAAVNRAYALGMAQAAMMHQSRTYWLTSSCTATNGVTINHVVPGCYFEARIAANGSTSLTMQTAGVVGGANYSKILGYSLPIRCSGGTTGSWHKVSVLLGSGGQWTEQPDAGIDGWRWRPVAGSAPGITRLVEITIYYDNGYRARVRELIGIGNPKGYVVRTTESAFNYDHNSSPSTAGYRLVIAQSQLSYTDVLAAGVWLIMGGNVSDTVIKLADIRGWDTYHTSGAPTLYLDAHAGDYGGVVQAEPPTILYGIGNNAYVRYGLEPYQRSWITSEAEAPYTEQPTE